jgi:hypothetical protein
VNTYSRLKSAGAVFATEKSLLILLLAFSVSLNVFLSYEISQSRNLVRLLSTHRKITVGEIAPLLKAHDENGIEVQYDFTARELPTVVYIQSAKCHWCEQNFTYLQQMAVQSTDKYHLVTLSLERAADGVTNLTTSNSKNLFDPSIESKITFDLSATPTTMLFSSEGKLEKIWKGAYHAERQKDIEKSLGVHLSGLKNTYSE